MISLLLKRWPRRGPAQESRGGGAPSVTKSSLRGGLAGRGWLGKAAALARSAGGLAAATAWCLFACAAPAAQVATGERGMVATGHPTATAAGLAALQKGGNAVDAAVAAGLMLGVVDGHNSGIGGGCFLLIRRADGEIAAIDGRETAPAAAHAAMFVREGKADSRLSQTGALASGTPGALAAYAAAAERFGRRPLREALLAAAEVAEGGFEVTRGYAGRLRAEAAELRRFPSSRAIFLQPDGAPFPEGERLVQTDLAATYRAIAEGGLAWFYEGAFARATEEWMAANGGILTAADFKSDAVKFREPLRTTYRGREIVGFPPPSSGGVHVAQLLNVLEYSDVRALGAESADFMHLTAEAMKLAFADRAHWLGDPAFSPVPRGLIGKEYARGLAARIRMDAASPVEGHGTPDGAKDDLFKHTTHFSTADAEGNWVACTATINTTFGSKVVIPGTGVLMNNEMDDFAISPGVPNAFGLVGGEANAVAPGKRPLSSMSPTIVLQDGAPVLAIGAAGGPTIISQTLLAIVRVVDFERPLEAAIGGARFHHQWQPDELKIERSAAAGVVEELRRRGHTVRGTEALGVSQGVGRGAGGKGFIGVADPRGGGAAAGW